MKRALALLLAATCCLTALPGRCLGAERLKMTEALHRQLMSENEDYRMADELLNETWELLKNNLSKEKYHQVLHEQREWLKYGRDNDANRYIKVVYSGNSMHPYVRATMHRVYQLSQLISVMPRKGRYIDDYGGMDIDIEDDVIFLIDGNVTNSRAYECIFNGRGIISKSWIIFDRDIGSEFGKIYALFLPGKVKIIRGIGIDGCPPSIGFHGEYTLKK